VKLLFDQNLSPSLVESLADIYPQSVHVQSVGLDRADDTAVWDFARSQNLVIVTKDADFQERSLIAGAPPKVIWIRRGNCSTSDIEAILRRHSDEALQLMQGDEVALVLF
jgi:predicted nuclease of predicted toxin-antitoxin system